MHHDILGTGKHGRLKGNDDELVFELWITKKTLHDVLDFDLWITKETLTALAPSEKEEINDAWTKLLSGGQRSYWWASEEKYNCLCILESILVIAYRIT